MEKYQNLRKNNSGKNDCSVIALSLLSGKPYAECAEALASNGRKPNKGATTPVILKSCENLGMKTEEMPRGHIFNFVKTIKALNGLLFQPEKKYLVLTRDHVTAIVDGKVEDWTENKKVRIERILEVCNSCPII